MGNKLLIKHRKIVGLVQLAIMALFWVWFLFCTPVTPLSGSLRGGASDNPIPAEGFWGNIGFYTRPADNGLTYFLMVIFCGLIMYKIISSCFFPNLNKNRNQPLHERRIKKSVRHRVRIRLRRY